MLTHTAVIRAVGIFLITAAGARGQNECVELESTKEAQGYLKYLKGDRATLNGNCVQYAISHVIHPVDSPGFKSYSETVKMDAIRTLVQYLDYRPSIFERRASGFRHP